MRKIVVTLAFLMLTLAFPALAHADTSFQPDPADTSSLTQLMERAMFGVDGHNYYPSQIFDVDEATGAPGPVQMELSPMPPFEGMVYSMFGDLTGTVSPFTSVAHFTVTGLPEYGLVLLVGSTIQVDDFAHLIDVTEVTGPGVDVPLNVDILGLFDFNL